MKKKEISGRDLLSIRLGRLNDEPDQIGAPGSGFTTELLFHQIIKSREAPASMSWSDMLRAVSEQLNIKQGH